MDLETLLATRECGGITLHASTFKGPLSELGMVGAYILSDNWVPDSSLYSRLLKYSIVLEAFLIFAHNLYFFDFPFTILCLICAILEAISGINSVSQYSVRVEEEAAT